MALTKVTAGVIAANAVVDSFGSQSITGDKIGLTAINANNIVDGTITAAKLAPGAAISNGQLSVVSSAVGVIPDSAAGRLPYKILGQVQPGANSLTTIYTVPASTNTVVTTITICNQSANNLTVQCRCKYKWRCSYNKEFSHYKLQSRSRRDIGARTKTGNACRLVTFSEHYRCLCCI
jgi:hypothetical protein